MGHLKDMPSAGMILVGVGHFLREVARFAADSAGLDPSDSAAAQWINRVSLSLLFWPGSDETAEVRMLRSLVAPACTDHTDMPSAAASPERTAGSLWILPSRAREDALYRLGHSPRNTAERAAKRERTLTGDSLEL
jgi:hypothetical protein